MATWYGKSRRFIENKVWEEYNQHFLFSSNNTYCGKYNDVKTSPRRFTIGRYHTRLTCFGTLKMTI